MALPEVLRDRLEALQRLGAIVDETAARWLTDQTGALDQDALHSIMQARRLIELTVDLALTHRVENHPALRSMQQSWQQRFTRIADAITQKQHILAESSQHHLAQTRAAQAYIGTKRLG